MSPTITATIPHLVTLLPCGMVTPFNQALRNFLDKHPDAYGDLLAEMEGNVNHENTYYPMLEKAQHPDELPDILIASDVNHLFHRPFQERFLSQGYFQEYLPHGKNALLETQGFYDPRQEFTMLSTNMLVIVADLEKLGDRKIPESWEDLLAPEFRNSIAIRGDENFFCNGVLLPFYHFWGLEAIRDLALNVVDGMHPAQMAKMAGSGKPGAPAIYIMPFFFHDKIVNKSKVRMIWPEEGAIPSPVFLLAKRSAQEEHRPLLDFLLSKDMSDLFTGRGFPFSHPDSHVLLPSQKLFWVGWDFLYNADVGQIKDTIQFTFRYAK